MLAEGMSAETVGTSCQGKELQSLAFNESPQQCSGPNTAIRGTFHWKLTQVKLQKNLNLVFHWCTKDKGDQTFNCLGKQCPLDVYPLICKA